MAKVTWTDDQRAAIYTEGCNLLVAAGAGSGKTAVLVQRIINKVANINKALDIDKLLIVTFTNAAASEMKERITKAINGELEKNPESVILQRQLALMNKASIMTLHSFCLEVIRSNFHILDIDPNFRVGDGTETLLLKTEVMEELFEELYEEETRKKEFERLLECYSGNRDDARLQEMVMSLYHFAMSSPFPIEKLNSMAEEFNVKEDFDFSQTQWAKVMLENVIIEIEGLQKIAVNALNIVKNTDELSNYIDNFTDDLAILQDISKAAENSWEALSTALQESKFGKLKTIKGVEDKETQETVKKARDKVKKQLEKIKNDIAPYSSENVFEDLNYLYTIMRQLSDMVINFIEGYGTKKKEKGILDFNDFEHFALKILAHIDEEGNVTPTKAAINLKNKYEEILVDEYQDSNDVQETIINTIARKDSTEDKSNNIFMVGDVKQSIYRFRQAKPELFLQKYSAYVHQKNIAADDEYINESQRKITLYKNFRSRKEVIDGVNFIFKQIMSENVGELNYDDNESLNFGAHFQEKQDESFIVGGSIELHLINNNGDDIEEESSEKHSEESINEDEELLSKIQIEARFVAKKIKELINKEEYKNEKPFKVFDNKLDKYRNVEFKDMVILLRTTSNWAEVFSEELKKEGIPNYSDVGTGYFRTVEISTILSLLQIIDNPRQDIPLISVLRSPIASFTEEELIDIRAFGKNIDFYEAMEMLINSEQEDDDFVFINLKEKCFNFINKLNEWRKISIHKSIDEFIWQLYTETGYFGFVGAMSGGEERQANLKILFQRAKQFQQTSYKGLFNFITFINKLKINDGDMGSAKILGENDNVVRIMSIHKSKGLEFPVVFLSALGKQFNLQDLNKKVLFHEKLGYGPDVVDLEKRISYPTVMKQAIKKKVKAESLSEEMRVLYVALTRAKEKLILTGVINKIDEKIPKWILSSQSIEEKLSEYDTINAKTYLDWIVPSLLRHNNRHEIMKDLDIPYSETVLIKDESLWNLNIWKKDDIIVSEEIMEGNIVIDELKEIHEKQEELNKEIDKRLSWKYGYDKAVSMATRFTVTELKKAERNSVQSDEGENLFKTPIVKKPSFMEDKKDLSAAEKGTLIHFIMQKIDLNKVSSIKDIYSEIERMVEKEFISEEEAKFINPHKILNFFKSKLGISMLKSENCRREIPFLIEVKSTEIYEELEEDKYKDESVLLQGIIDCFFEENNEYILIDYKTDYATKENLEEIKERYKMQLTYYSKAIEKITGKKVTKKYLYLFGIEEGILI